MELNQQQLFVHRPTGHLWQLDISVLIAEENSINAIQMEELPKELLSLALKELLANAVQVMNVQCQILFLLALKSVD